jgi:hypothetical protein
MMILCPLCHDLATKRGLPLDEQWELKQNPYNVREGIASGRLVMNQPYCAVRIGGSLIVGEDASFSIGGETLFRIGLVRPSRTLTVSATLYDEAGTCLAIIEENEWVSGDPFPWDIESDHQQLAIRQRRGQIALEVDARKEPVEVRAELWRDKHRVSLTPSGIALGDREAAVKFINLGLVAFSIDLDPATGDAQMITDPRFREGVVVPSGGGDAQLLRSCLAFWDGLVATKAREIGRNGLCWCESGLKFKRCHGA